VKGSKWTWAVLTAGLVALAACGRADDGAEWDPDMEQARAGWPEALSAQIDSGNTAYRAGRYDDAARYYRLAAEQNPDVGAAWFGLHMAERARGDSAAAAEALHHAEALTPGLGFGHPGPGDGHDMEGMSPHGMGMPPHGMGGMDPHGQGAPPHPPIPGD
jgi:tetratricopeptide (TPR) repeat protein